MNITELHDAIQSNMVDENIVDRSMFHKTYSIYDGGITYRVDQVNRSCGKGCEIGTFLVGIEIQGESYIPQLAQKCLL